MVFLSCCVTVALYPSLMLMIKKSSQIRGEAHGPDACARSLLGQNSLAGVPGHSSFQWTTFISLKSHFVHSKNLDITPAEWRFVLPCLIHLFLTLALSDGYLAHFMISQSILLSFFRHDNSHQDVILRKINLLNSILILKNKVHHEFCFL